MLSFACLATRHPLKFSSSVPGSIQGKFITDIVQDVKYQSDTTDKRNTSEPTNRESINMVSKFLSYIRLSMNDSSKYVASIVMWFSGGATELY